MRVRMLAIDEGQKMRNSNSSAERNYRSVKTYVGDLSNRKTITTIEIRALESGDTIYLSKTEERYALRGLSCGDTTTEVVRESADGQLWYAMERELLSY